MTAAQPQVRPSADRQPYGSGSGGMPAALAVLRWSWRLLRREWRRQALLTALIATAVGAAVCGLAAVHAYVQTPAGTFGSASQRLHLDGGAGGAALPAAVAEARAKLAPADVTAHRLVPVPGALDGLDIRAEDPRGPFAAGRLRLLSGRYPSGSGEVALTPSAADLFHTRTGAPVVLGGQRLTVTGTVQNPGLLGDTFALAAPAAGSAAGSTVAGRPATSADVLTDAPSSAVDALRRSSSGGAPVMVEQRGDFGRAAADAFIVALATVGLLLVSLVAAAGFAAVAQRRLRQIGMLGTIGATDRQLRLVLLGHGALTGAVATAGGAILGGAVWMPLAPWLESAAGHRIDRLALPWPMLTLLLVFGVLTPTAAAWWPARAMARVPTAQALSARPPRPLPARQSVWAAAALLAAGAGALIPAHRANGLLVVAGIVAVVLGMLLLSAPVVRLMAAAARRTPFTTRLALRDLGRHQARSGAALAAITLAIGLPVAISVLAAASQHTADTGNLSDRQTMIRAGTRDPVIPLLSDAARRAQQSAVGRWAASVGGTATPLEMAYDPAVPHTSTRSGLDGQPVVETGRRTGANVWSSIPLYVATPAAVREFGLGAAIKAAPDAQILSSLPGSPELTVLGATGRDRPGDAPPSAHVPGSSTYTSVPHAFLTPAAARARGLRTIPAGWLVTAGHELTGQDRAAARDMAAAGGMSAEFRDRQGGLRTVRLVSVAAGAALALGVLAMTVGTLRAESTDDLRTLTATGATSGNRRALTAATAGSLALAGTVLGTLGAYLVLLSAYSDDLSPLAHVPVVPLLMAFPGIPVLAAAVGWLSAGREPPGLARRLLE
ncbi:FtsX-like permease family protein [Streptomyces cocklensis]|uniref:ABC transport system permease protein n=1 Tax=Actinacidiphila cocklensis TaxID=887465 RepID=A0A9W4DKD7_9ACTN|nr:FtsX-like permease family protein [Actinacidiphila cocklensis]MDD1062245.1 FtsX-like permease family protein [Actinacidiphila cocklensis]CAG6391308.1 Putative ABC transport system permease protein [Actinacidiphila cocklensis]